MRRQVQGKTFHPLQPQSDRCNLGRRGREMEVPGGSQRPDGRGRSRYLCQRVSRLRGICASIRPSPRTWLTYGTGSLSCSPIRRGGFLNAWKVGRIAIATIVRGLIRSASENNRPSSAHTVADDRWHGELQGKATSHRLMGPVLRLQGQEGRRHWLWVFGPPGRPKHGQRCRAYDLLHSFSYVSHTLPPFAATAQPPSQKVAQPPPPLSRVHHDSYIPMPMAYDFLEKEHGAEWVDICNSADSRLLCHYTDSDLVTPTVLDESLCALTSAHLPAATKAT